MEPIFEYFDIIVNRLKNPLPKGEYGEKHHIYPKSCGGSNDKNNLVKLTPEEHYRCHLLLTKIFSDEPENYRKMVYAWGLMSNRDTKQSAEEYGALKRAYAKAVSEDRKGKSSWLKGKHISETQKQQISETLKGHSVSEESKQKNREKHVGKRHTEESKQRISASLKGIKRSAEYCRRMSEQRKGAGNPMFGRVPWNKGLKKRR